MYSFDTENLLLTNPSAKRLFFDYAADMPIIDYHNHLDPAELAANREFRNVAELWLAGDHYKWRALRWLGVDEELITGSAGDKEKFMAWAAAVPKLAGNPLYQWSQLELSRYFGIEERLTAENAEEIWHRCNERLSGPQLRAGGILDHFKVRTACTTDDPVSDLAGHLQMKAHPTAQAQVVPTFRPDRAMEIESGGFAAYIAELGKAAGKDIQNYADLWTALEQRMDFFHGLGCRLSDHGLDSFAFAPAGEREAEVIFSKALQGLELTQLEVLKYRTFTLLCLGELYHKRGWAMQLHIGAIRNNNDRMFSKLGPNTGYDSIRDFQLAEPLNAFLNELDKKNSLPKTIVYSLNPYHFELIASTIGNFQTSEISGKLQLGAAWWFNDQKEGMLAQLKALSSVGLISTFVGMLTDSRSLMSFPRHEYFRRVLCRLLGEWMEEGELPKDYDYIGGIVQDICYNNAERYFAFEK